MTDSLEEPLHAVVIDNVRCVRDFTDVLQLVCEHGDTFARIESEIDLDQDVPAIAYIPDKLGSSAPEARFR